jgi:DNA-binding transcriptional MocR family regulator
MNAPFRSAGADRSAPAIRPEASGAPTSGIVEVMSYGRGRPGLIPLWAGEGDLPTPDFICAAASRALADGETFYSWQRGLPEFRDALARYHGQALGLSCAPDRFTATVGGMHALQIAMRIVAGPGDEVIVPTPAWPNFDGAVAVSGAAAVSLPMQPNARRLDAGPRPAGGGDRAAHACPGHQLAFQSDRLDREPGRASPDPRSRAPARHLDHRG